MRKTLIALLAGTTIAGAPAALAQDKAARDPVLAAGEANIRKLADQLAIPHETFELPNGLRVIVAPDHSNPSVVVSVTYNVGSKFEPRGRTGFAHLFEHLMFNGSENAPGDIFKPLTEAGAITANGSTSEDWTNYYEFMPRPALERALFLESDRMGHLLGAVDQATLDEQRGVVENEKRQNDNQPGSGIYERITSVLYPSDHPYGHSVIGSMEDLEAADLDDVRSWFRTHYGPNNALIVLAGDIDVPTARTLVTRYFGDIPRGTANVLPPVPVPTLPAPRVETITNDVARPRIIRVWAVPADGTPDATALDAFAGALAGFDDSPVRKRLVEKDKLFDSISVYNSTGVNGGRFTFRGDVAGGVDPAVAAKALDAEIAKALATPPREADLRRWANGQVITVARGLESMVARADRLTEGMVAKGDPDAVFKQARAYTTITPDRAVDAARRWLSRPVYALTVLPGPRMMKPELIAARPPRTAEAAGTPPVRVARMPMPEAGGIQPPRPPAITHAKLSNGIPIWYSRKPGNPFTLTTVRFKGGTVTDPIDKVGLAAMAMTMTGRGYAGHDYDWVNERQDRLGVVTDASASADGASVGITVPSVNAAIGYDMLADQVQRPDFPLDQLAQQRRQKLADLEGNRNSPGLAAETVLPVLFDANSPYAQRSRPDTKAIQRLTREDLLAFRTAWLRPEVATIFVVSDRPLEELQPLLEARFARWTVAGTPGRLAPRAPIAPATPQIVLFDRPGAAQAQIDTGQPLERPSDDDQQLLKLGDQMLGSGFLGRLNMDLREAKHWSYGIGAAYQHDDQASYYRVSGSVQPDKAGDAVGAIRSDVAAFIGDKPPTAAEFAVAKAGVLRSAIGSFDSSFAMLEAMQEIANHGRSDDYHARQFELLRDSTLDQVMAVVRRTITPDRWSWTIAGDAKTTRPQLEALGLPIKVVTTEDLTPSR